MCRQGHRRGVRGDFIRAGRVNRVQGRGIRRECAGAAPRGGGCSATERAQQRDARTARTNHRLIPDDHDLGRRRLINGQFGWRCGSNRRTAGATDDDLVELPAVSQRGSRVRVVRVGCGVAHVRERDTVIEAHLPLVGQARARGGHGEDNRRSSTYCLVDRLTRYCRQRMDGYHQLRRRRRAGRKLARCAQGQRRRARRLIGGRRSVGRIECRRVWREGAARG